VRFLSQTASENQSLGHKTQVFKRNQREGSDQHEAWKVTNVRKTVEMAFLIQGFRARKRERGV